MQSLFILLVTLLASLCRAQLGYPGVMNLARVTMNLARPFQAAFYLYDSQPVCRWALCGLASCSLVLSRTCAYPVKPGVAIL